MTWPQSSMFSFIRRRPILAGIVGSLLCVAAVPQDSMAQSWKWSFEDVDTTGIHTSLATDSQGNLHLSYAIEEEGGAFKYAFRPSGGSKWFTMTLEKQLGAAPTFLTLDAQDNPHICYTPGGNLRYAHYNGREWLYQRIAPGSGSIQFTCSIVLEVGGSPHFSWYHYRTPDGTDYHHLKHAEYRDGAWFVRTLDLSGATGKWNSMVLDDKGRPRIVYTDVANGDFKSAVFDGKDWVISILDSPRFNPQGGWVGMGNSMVRTSDHHYLVSYYAEKSLKFARNDGSKWTAETIDAIRWLGSWVGYRTSLALDTHGWPHISYEDGGNLKHAYWNGTRWVIQVIVSAASDPYRHSAIAVDHNDVIYISFRDPTDSSLRLAVGRPEQTSQAAAEKK